MKLRKFNNEKMGDYYTFDVDDKYEAMYAAKYPKNVIKMKEESISKNKQALTRIQQFKIQEHKYGWEKMLQKQKIQIVENKTTSFPQTYSYIRFQNKKWKPIIFLNANEDIMSGGRAICTQRNDICNVLGNKTSCLFQETPSTNNTNIENKYCLTIPDSISDITIYTSLNISEFMKNTNNQINFNNNNLKQQKITFLKEMSSSYNPNRYTFDNFLNKVITYQTQNQNKNEDETEKELFRIANLIVDHINTHIKASPLPATVPTTPATTPQPQPQLATTASPSPATPEEAPKKTPLHKALKREQIYTNRKKTCQNIRKKALYDLHQKLKSAESTFEYAGDEFEEEEAAVKAEAKEAVKAAETAEAEATLNDTIFNLNNFEYSELHHCLEYEEKLAFIGRRFKFNKMVGKIIKLNNIDLINAIVKTPKEAQVDLEAVKAKIASVKAEASAKAVKAAITKIAADAATKATVKAEEASAEATSKAAQQVIQLTKNIYLLFEKHGHRALNDMMPCQELLDVIVKLGYIDTIKSQQATPHSTVLNGQQNGGSDCSESETGVVRCNDNNYWKEYLRRDTLSDSDDDDEDWNPEMEDMVDAFEDEMTFEENIQDLVHERGQFTFTWGRAFKTAIIVMFFSIMMGVFNMYSHAFLFDKSLSVNEAKVSNIENVAGFISEAIIPFQNTTGLPVEKRNRPYDGILSVFSNDDNNKIKITVANYDNKLKEIKTPNLFQNINNIEPPQCAKNTPGMLNVNQQLLIHKHNLFEHYVELIHFIRENDFSDTNLYLQDKKSPVEIARGKLNVNEAMENEIKNLFEIPQNSEDMQKKMHTMKEAAHSIITNLQEKRRDRSIKNELLNNANLAAEAKAADAEAAATKAAEEVSIAELKLEEAIEHIKNKITEQQTNSKHGASQENVTLENLNFLYTYLKKYSEIEPVDTKFLLKTSFLTQLQSKLNTSIEELFMGKSLTTYVDIINKKLLPDLIQSFHNFINLIDNTNQLTSVFAALEESKAYMAQSFEFKKRMHVLKDTIHSHLMTSNKQAFVFQDHKCVLPKNNGEIKYHLNEYTWALLLDLKTGYQNIAKRQIKIYSEYIPIVKELLDIHDTLKTQNQPTVDENKLQKIIDEIENLPQINVFMDIAMLLDDTSKDIFYRIDKALSLLTTINPDATIIINNYKRYAENKELQRSIMSVFGVFDLSDITAKQMFQTFIEYSEPPYMMAKSSTKHVLTHIAPNFGFVLNDISSMMVKVVQENLLTDDDRYAVNYIAGTRIANVVYDLFKIKEVNDILDIVRDAVPGAKTLNSIITLTKDIYDGDNNDIYIRIVRSSMLQIDSKLKALRLKVNSKVSINKMLSSVGLLIQEFVKDQKTFDLAGLAMNISNDYVRLAIEMNKLELALIIFHLQNDILEGSEQKTTPSYLQNNIQLEDDHEFLSQYHSDKTKYVSKVLQRVMNIMGLLILEKNKYL